MANGAAILVNCIVNKASDKCWRKEKKREDEPAFIFFGSQCCEIKTAPKVAAKAMPFEKKKKYIIESDKNKLFLHFPAY